MIDTLYSEDGSDYLVWKWRPLGAGAGRRGGLSDARRQEGGRARRRHARVGQVGPALRRVRLGRGPRRHGRRRPRLARHAVRLGRRHHPQRLPGLRVGRDLRPGARVDRGAGLERLRRLRLGRGGHRQRPGADPGRAVRRGARRRRRHDAEGLLRAGRRRRAQGRPGLVALPSHGRHQPDLLRPVRRAGAWTASARPRRTSHRSR